MTGEPREQYQRVVNVIPATASEARAVEIFLEGWRRSKESAGGSYDDAGIGALNDRTANLYDIPSAKQAEFRAWYIQHYPGVKINFLPKTSNLAVPYASQLGPTAAFALGDCGAACIAMLLNFRNIAVSVDDVSRATGEPGGFTSLSAPDLITVASTFGLTIKHAFANSIESVRLHINSGNPVVALVNYAALPNQNKNDQTYTRGHWLVLVGLDNQQVVYHDPFWPSAANGAFKTMTFAEFDHAWSTTNSDFSVPRQILVVASTVIP